MNPEETVPGPLPENPKTHDPLVVTKPDPTTEPTLLEQRDVLDEKEKTEVPPPQTLQQTERADLSLDLLGALKGKVEKALGKLPKGVKVLDPNIYTALGSAEKIGVLAGPPGDGGAPHEYAARFGDPVQQHLIKFQHGLPTDPTIGTNGLTMEVLLAICADRLSGFQAGKFACKHNQRALDSVKLALVYLHQRTKDRLDRNVESTYET